MAALAADIYRSSQFVGDPVYILTIGLGRHRKNLFEILAAALPATNGELAFKHRITAPLKPRFVFLDA